MSEETQDPQAGGLADHNPSAPVIYFETVIANYLARNGLIVLELAVPLPVSHREARLTGVAHLRCDVQAARDLRESLSRAISALDALAAPQAGPAN